jgi:hypothetical protein
MHTCFCTCSPVNTGLDSLSQLQHTGNPNPKREGRYTNSDNILLIGMRSQQAKQQYWCTGLTMNPSNASSNDLVARRRRELLIRPGFGNVDWWPENMGNIVRH